MAKVYVTQFADLRGNTAFSAPIQTDVITSSGASQAVCTVAATCNFVRIHTDGIISYTIGKAPTATVNDARLAASQTEYHCVQKNDIVAVITNT